MKIAGWILVILGILSGLGILVRGGNLGGPIFFIIIGTYLIHCANQREREKKKKQNWENNN